MTLVPAYRFTVTCAHCGGAVEEVNRVRQSITCEIAVVACTNEKCGRHFDLTLRLSPIRREGAR